MSAAELIDHSDVTGLMQLLRDYGEVERARQVAEAMWAARPIQTTAALRDLVAGITRSRGRIHPATQVFQALRIAVNDELRRLSYALPALMGALAPGGRLAIITFHSLEDRIVKRAFRAVIAEPEDQPGFGQPVERTGYPMLLMTRKPIEPTEEEIASNPRARSAKLRVIERK